MKKHINIETHPVRNGVTLTEEIELVEEIKCNQCQKVVWHVGDAERDPKQSEFLSVTAAWFKNSPWPGHNHEFHLCLECYTKLMEQFALKVDNYKRTEPYSCNEGRDHCCKECL